MIYAEKRCDFHVFLFIIRLIQQKETDSLLTLVILCLPLVKKWGKTTLIRKYDSYYSWFFIAVQQTET